MVILALEDNGKFISAYPEYGAVCECLAYELAGSLDIIVARLVTLCIVDHLEIVQIAYSDPERLAVLIVDRLLEISLEFPESGNVPGSRKTVSPGCLVGHVESLDMLLFLLDISLTVLNTDDDVCLVRRPADRHPRILRLPVAYLHSVVQSNPQTVLELCDEVILVDEQLEPLPVFRMDYPVCILLRHSEEVFAFLADLKLAVELVRGELLVI